MSPDSSSRTDTGRVFTGTAVDDGIDSNLDRVLIRHQVDDGESVVDDAYGLQLLSVVAAVHHEGVGQTLDDWALGLAEAFYGVAAGGVREVDGVADVHVVAICLVGLLALRFKHSVLSVSICVYPLVYPPIIPSFTTYFPSLQS